MGFSVGGKATYEYGLNNSSIFGGFIPIGAAVTGIGPFTGIIGNSTGKPYYLVHGGNDSPGTRFTPMLNGLTDNCAIVNSLLMPGIGHTIDFPNRNQILSDAYHWIDSVNMAPDTVNFLFSPITPANGTNLVIQGFENQLVTFSWNKSSFGPDCARFEVIADLPTGNFSSPIYTQISGNQGSDTTIQMTYHVLDSLLQDQGVPVGNTATIKWAVAVTYYNRFVDTTKSNVLILQRERVGFGLLTPADNKVIELDEVSNLFMDWQDMLGSGITYELLFDTINGDFSTPVKTYISSNSGQTSLSSQSHQNLYYDFMFEKNLAVGDSLGFDWTVRASNTNFDELASSDRTIYFKRENVGFKLINPEENTLIFSREGINLTFMWDSIPLTGYTYEVIFDTINGDFTNPLTIFPSNSSGMNRRLFVDFETLDSILRVFEIPYGDTLDAKWTVKATSPKGDFFPVSSFDVQIFRDFPKGITEGVTSTSGIQIFPNPVKDYLSVSFERTIAKDVAMKLYDLSGKLVLPIQQMKAGNSESQLFLGTLPSGSYLLQIDLEDGPIRKKVVIE